MAAAITVGRVLALTQNVVYALPAQRVLLFTDATTPTIQQSLTEAFTANVAVTLSGGQAELAGGFIRCTSGNISVIIKTF
jgi:hypothetical protein